MPAPEAMSRHQFAGLPAYEDAYYGQAKVHQLPVELVKQFREPGTSTTPARVGAVTRSLRRGDGIRDPLHIVQGDDGPLLYDGHHRLRAAEKHGMTHVPVRVTL